MTGPPPGPAAPSPGPAAPSPGGEPIVALPTLLRSSWVSIKKNLPQTIVLAAVAALVGWAVNVWWLARRYEGFNVPSGSAAVGRGNMVYGIVFWAVAGSIVFGAIAYRRAVGKQRFWNDLRALPRAFADAFSRDRSGWAHLLWGFGIALVLTQLLSPSLSGLLAIGAALTLFSILGRVILRLAITAWMSLMRSFRPAKADNQPPLVAAAVAGIGTAAALLLGFFVDDLVPKLVLAGAAIVIAFLVSRGALSPGGAGMLLLLVGALAAAFSILDPAVALADDGGWQECGSNWSDWIGCDGTDEVVRTSVVGGLSCTFGAAFGSGLGTVVGTFPSPGLGSPISWIIDDLGRDPDAELTEEQRDAIADWILDTLEDDPDGAKLDALTNALNDADNPPPSAPEAEPVGPLPDPYDSASELHVDPESGLVWWPYDGAEGHWVTPDEATDLVRAEEDYIQRRGSSGGAAVDELGPPPDSPPGGDAEAAGSEGDEAAALPPSRLPGAGAQEPAEGPPGWAPGERQDEPATPDEGSSPPVPEPSELVERVREAVERNPAVQKVISAEDAERLVRFAEDEGARTIEVALPERETTVLDASRAQVQTGDVTNLPDGSGVRATVLVDPKAWGMAVDMDLPAASVDLVVRGGRLEVDFEIGVSQDTLRDWVPKEWASTLDERIDDIRAGLQERVDQINDALPEGRRLQSISVTDTGALRIAAG